MLRTCLLILIVFAAAGPAAAEFLVTVVPPASWGAPDADIGVGGGLVEDFEDVVLVEGLLISVSAPDGSFAGSGAATLAATFDPVGDDPYGEAFTAGIWDGSRCLLSSVGNAAIDYGSTDARRIRLEVPDGTAWIGLALQQLTRNEPLVVNDVSLGRVQGLGLMPSAGRNGYLIVASDDPDDPVFSVAVGGGGDAFVIDHVVFAEAGSVPAVTRCWSGIKALYR